MRSENSQDISRLDRLLVKQLIVGTAGFKPATPAV